jgi:hypothetical protein
MTGSRNKFDDDGEFDQLAQDLDLDMDAPIGATFAAALREREGDVAVVDAEFTLDDDGFMTPPPKSASGHAHNAIFGEDQSGYDAGGSEANFASAQLALQEPAERKRAIWLEPETPASPPVEALAMTIPLPRRLRAATAPSRASRYMPSAHARLRWA